MDKIPALLKSSGIVQFNGIHGEITKTFTNTAPLLFFALTKIFKDGTLKEITLYIFININMLILVSKGQFLCAGVYINLFKSFKPFMLL